MNIKQVILGSNGAMGQALAGELLKFSADITLVSRSPQAVNSSDKLLALDLTLPANVERAIQDMDIVYITIGFAYRSSVWQKLWFPFMESVIQSCIRHNAKLVFLGNIYALGSNAVNHITESTPPQPTSKKGQVRAQVDQLLLSSIESGQLQGIIARAPDFFGGNSGVNSIMMSLVLFSPLMRELAEMNYQFERDYFFDSSKFNEFFDYTPMSHAEAVKLAVQG
jgi:nucleoside-diphosphate-sugar epimerase